MKRAICIVATVVCCMVLVSCGAPSPQEQLRDQVMAALKSADETERANAVSQIPTLGDKTSSSFQYVVKALDDESARVRAAAISVLGSYENEVSLCLDKLASIAADDSSVDVRITALSALSVFAEDKDAVLTAVKAGLRSDSLKLAVHCGHLISSTYSDSLPGEAQQIATVIKKGIEAASAGPGSRFIGLELCFSLADLGTKATAALPLIEAAKQKSGLDASVAAVLKATIEAIRGRDNATKVSELLDPLRTEGRL